jgi:hypothetical protein
LLLALAKVLADIDPLTSVSLLKEAISAFNSANKSQANWYNSIEIGAIEREFTLNLRSVDRGFQSCIERLANAEPDATIALSLTLADEALRGEALVAFSKSIWKKESSD